RPLDYHLDLAARLAPLRRRGVMILASGNVVHNLQHVLWDRPDAAYDWGERFDDAAVEQLAADPAVALRLREHPDYALAVPTPDHFIPLLYLAGVAAADEGTATPWLRGHALGSISMTCYQAGAGAGPAPEREGAAGLPVELPHDQTHISPAGRPRQ